MLRVCRRPPQSKSGTRHFVFLLRGRYLDSTFCSWFHSFAQSKGEADSVRSGGTTIIFSVWVLALFVLGFYTARLSHAQLQVARGTRAERLLRRAARARTSVVQAVQAVRRLSNTATGRKLKGVDSAGSAKSSGAGSSAPKALGPPIRRLTRMQTISTKESRTRQWQAAMLIISHMSLRWMVLCSVAAITPITFFVHLFSPCYECYDFESAATHEIGHLLGLNHPDKFASRSRMALAPMGPDSCHDPLAFLTPPGSAVAADAPYSVMHSFARHPSEVCLTEDDLHGLNYLYPTCGNAILPPASCHKSERNIGWLRFAMWVIFPVLIAMAILLCLTGLVKRHQRERLGSFFVKLRDLKNKNNQLIEAMRVAVLKAEEAEAAQEAQEAQAQSQQPSEPSGGVGQQLIEAQRTARRKKSIQAQETLGLIERELTDCSTHMEKMASELHHRKRAVRTSLVNVRLLTPRSPAPPPACLSTDKKPALPILAEPSRQQQGGVKLPRVDAERVFRNGRSLRNVPAAMPPSPELAILPSEHL